MNVGIELLPFSTGNWLVAGMPRLFGSLITGHRTVALRRDGRKQGADRIGMRQPLRVGQRSITTVWESSSSPTGLACGVGREGSSALG